MEKIDVIVGNVKNEVHNIAKILFIKELEKIGFNVLDLGISVSTEVYIETIKETNATALVLTGLLPSATEYMKNISKKLKQEHIRNKIKILVAGPNVNEEWLEKTEADAITKDISGGINILRDWLGK
jgi:methanogenic corrinoid protein MtbC1